MMFRNINRALNNKGVMTLSMVKGQYRATMHWSGSGERLVGNYNNSIEWAMETLDLRIKESTDTRF